MVNLPNIVTVRFARQEQAELAMWAARAGMRLGPFVRYEILRSIRVPRETRLALASILRLQEKIVRIFAAASSGDLSPQLIRSIENDVKAMNADPLVAALLEGPK